MHEDEGSEVLQAMAKLVVLVWRQEVGLGRHKMLAAPKLTERRAEGFTLYAFTRSSCSRREDWDSTAACAVFYLSLIVRRRAASGERMVLGVQD